MKGGENNDKSKLPCQRSSGRRIQVLRGLGLQCLSLKEKRWGGKSRKPFVAIFDCFDPTISSPPP